MIVPRTLYKAEFDSIDDEILSIFKEQFISRNPFIIRWKGFDDIVLKLRDRGIYEHYNAIVYRINELKKSGKIVKEVRNIDGTLEAVFYIYIPKEKKVINIDRRKKLSHRCRKCGSVIFSDSVLCPSCC